MPTDGTLIVDLLRHGEAEGGARCRGSTDDPVTKRGWKQMRKATSGERWDRIVTSPLCRCRLFAESLAQRLACPIEQQAAFRERHFGAWEGRTFDAIAKEATESPLFFWTDPARHTPPEGESFADFLGRVGAAWEDLMTETPPGRVLVVTHGGTVRGVLARVLELPPTALFRLAVPYASRTRIRVDRQDGTTWTTLEHHGA